MIRSSLAGLLLVLTTYSCADGSAGSFDTGGGSPGDPNASNDGQTPSKPGAQKPDPQKPGDAAFELPADGSLPTLRRVQTEHLGQLTGTQTNRAWEHGIIGTDLGASFERDGKLVYLFGDSWTPGGARQDQDSVAWSTETAIPKVGSLPKLTWATNASNQFLAPVLSGVSLGGMNVPMEGIPVGGKTYAFFTSGWNAGTEQYSNSVLAEMNGIDIAGLKVTHNVASKKFINVSAVVEGTTAFIYGSGNYRKSPVYLAKVDVAQIGDRTKWQYLGSGGSFGASEDGAQAVAATPCVGELSVRKFEKVGLYFMAYNCATPGGIQLRWARSAQGPWSEPINVFDNDRDGFGQFIHASESAVGYDDGVSEPGRYGEQGGSYGPYLVPRYFEVEQGSVLSLVYVMSSWNPYQAHLMRTRIALASNTIAPKTRGTELPAAKLANANFAQGPSVGWQGSGFVTFDNGDGTKWITSYAGSGDANTGKIWQDFAVDAGTTEVRFKVRGGDARVMLLHGSEVVRATQGRRTNTPDTNVVWNISEFRGETVRLQIEDTLTAPWGFISASPFELR